MTQPAYYNENDAEKAAWLREVIKAGLVAPGEVDERSIAEVRSEDLRGFAQCHFFASIGCWSYALRLAGWPDDRPCWTGSCPCQSFSCAGKGEGFDDPRHLWPIWYHLICECRPGVVFGEQADAAIGHGWLDLVSTDMEAQEYAFAAAVLGAHSVGAGHKRQRLYFCAHSEAAEILARHGEVQPGAGKKQANRSGNGCLSRHGSDSNGWLTGNGNLQRSGEQRLLTEDSGTSNGSDTDRSRARARGPGWLDPLTARSVTQAGATRGFWADCDWWHARDGKYRPIEPGLFPLAHGAANRVLKLRGYGDAIVPQVAQAFIESFIEAEVSCLNK